ncbi:hypothetical protein J1N35_043848 [Gossypium stocksii]|uniref:Uncharacterized protein n=1 Tax=Gossypium stocksii TaxID=47602 RepID=A0A9D3U848_9ROSI|nr:hypothetical protein J1N35_046121 [Gossypium stocksii]KAH1031674.1 hypothetical protein J1N35_043848 [Gossypium stocksii]
MEREKEPVSPTTRTNPITVRVTIDKGKAVEEELEKSISIDQEREVEERKEETSIHATTPATTTEKGEYEAHGYKLCLGTKDNSEPALSTNKEAISNATMNLMESSILAQDEHWRHA